MSKKTSLDEMSRSFEQFFNPSPYVFFCQDMQGIIQHCNKAALSTFGFQSHDAMVGKTSFDFQCPAAENAEDFITLDRQVIKDETIVTALISDSYPYGPDLHIVEKTPVMEGGRLVGILTRGQSINTKHVLGTIGAHLSDKYRIKGDSGRKIYTLQEKNNRSLLSAKEEECLFYLLYGKTAKEIATILCRSQRTIENHLEHIRNKMDCSSKSELIEKAMVSGYMNKIPKSLLSEKFILVL